LGDQLLRSGTSILSNYIEGQAASSKKDFIKYFEVSLKSINESKVWIALLKDTGKIKKDEARWFLDELKEFGNIFASSILTLKGKKIK
jgi:four helix bundle protein